MKNSFVFVLFFWCLYTYLLVNNLIFVTVGCAVVTTAFDSLEHLEFKDSVFDMIVDYSSEIVQPQCGPLLHVIFTGGQILPCRIV